LKTLIICRICGNPDLSPILSLGDQYLTGIFPRSPDDKITHGPLDLVRCTGEGNCGLLQLGHSYDSEEMYGENYGYRSGLNKSMVSHLKAKVEQLMGKLSLSDGDIVLDIGSNDGTLLSFYPESVQRVGMDPTSEKFLKYYKKGIEVITDFFSVEAFQKRFGLQKAKVITSIAMFYDLEDPMKFVRQIVDVLADDGIWHLEQSYMPLMLQENAYDTVCHEHLEYYGLHQIKWMTDRCGLRILDVETNYVNGGSFAVTVCKNKAPYTTKSSAVEAMLDSEIKAELHTAKPYKKFREQVFAHRDELRELIGRLIAEGSKILGYGASTKGNVILQFCGFTPREIPAMAEVNPDKFGAFTPGTIVPIISEAEAHAQKPNYFLVMPWHFRSNLLEREKTYLNQGGKMIFPLPKIEIVGR
jgi:cyclopropane fatty-acyl-phospholipid synthase-like methyltransferase